MFSIKYSVSPSFKEAPKPAVTIDPETGRKVYNGPKLKSRRVVDGKEWGSSHPGYNG